ncbi:hypothetical protein ANTRET_LOCUS7207 [Anthophora retusa]
MRGVRTIEGEPRSGVHVGGATIEDVGGASLSGRAEVRRSGWRGVRASEPGRGAVRQSGKPLGKQGRQAGRQASRQPVHQPRPLDPLGLPT